MADENEGDGNGDEGSDDGGGQAADIGQAIATAMAPLADGLTKLNDRIDGLTTHKGDDEYDDGGKGDEDTGQNDDPQDFDLMTNRELIGYVKGEFQKGFTQLSEDIKSTRASGEKTAAAAEAERMSAKHDDFWDLRREVSAQIEANPYLTLDQAYKLAKVENPDKVKDITDAKLKGTENDPEKVKAAAEERSKYPFGGLLPTSGKTSRNEKMTTDQAADAAWDEHFGSATTVNTVQ